MPCVSNCRIIEKAGFFQKLLILIMFCYCQSNFILVKEVAVITATENKNHTYALGIDIGSTTVKIAILNECHEILFSDYERHFANIQETLEATLDMVLSDTQYSNMNTQFLSVVSSADTGDTPAFAGVMLKVSGLELSEEMDFASLDEESVNIMNSLYSAISESLADSIEGLDKLDLGMWKNVQSYYLKLHMEMTVEGSFYVMDEYCTFLNGEFYVFVFFTTQKESLSAAETIMNSMIVGRHTFYPGG